MTREIQPFGSIGGGDHDVIAYKIVQMKKHLGEESLEQLKEEALKMETYINQKTGHFILGGLHDYIETLNKEDLVQVMTRMMINNVELLEINFYESVASPVDNIAFLENEKPQKLGGLHDYIFTFEEETLKNWSLAAEKYNSEQSQGSLIGGGIHDRISKMKKIDFVEYLLGMIRKYPSLDSSETLNQLCNSYGITSEKQKEEPAFVGGLVDYIWRETDDVLRNWALTCDKFDKEKRNIKVYGGLEDYVNILTREQLMDFILKHSRTYSELNSNIKLNQLAQTYGIIASPTQVNEQEPEPHILGGLSDYIWKQDVEVLRQWALTCERYEKEKKNLTLIGGLVNYVRLLGKEELIKIILNYAKKFPELNSGVKLNKMALDYGIAPSDEVKPQPKQQQEVPQILGGLDDYVWIMPEDTLRQWALTCEKYDRTKNNLDFDGGLHDYLFRLTKEQLINIILDFAKKNPELNSGVKLTELSVEYGFVQGESTQKTPETILGGGIHDIIGRVKDEVLLSWALTCDKYDKTTRNINIRGGLVDYVRLLKREELIKIVLDYVQKYPELNSVAKLQELAISYGIEAPQN